jgi:hypothetical protein
MFLMLTVFLPFTLLNNSSSVKSYLHNDYCECLTGCEENKTNGLEIGLMVFATLISFVYN